MERQKLLKSDGKIVIVSDFREKEVMESLKRLGVAVNQQPLEVGDFVCSGNVCIERKSYDDFISSIIDGRIFEQAQNMKENFEKSIFVVEGYSTREINENALKGAIASLLIDFNVSILSTKNPMDTAKTIYWIAKKEQTEGRQELSIKVGKKPKEDKKLQEFIVSSIPGVSIKTARKLLEEFRSVKQIFSASTIELEKIVGKKKAEKIWKIINGKYKRI